MDYSRDDRPLVILGASARSLAESAARAGWAVHAADLFCDLDLTAAARRALAADSSGVRPYPWSLVDAAASFPTGAPWCYTGGIENHPDLIAATAALRPLAGCGADCVRSLRDPHRLEAALRTAGLGFPETLFSAANVPTDGTFLVKPLGGAGGRGIHRWFGGASSGALGRSATTRVWQRFVAGAPLSASFVMESGRARLVGVTRQLLGEPWCHAVGFAWCGAVTLGDARRPPSYRPFRGQLDRLGDVLGERFAPLGAIGVDFVVEPGGRLTVIEVNPRPTASMELFERLTEFSVARGHLGACGVASPTSGPPPPRSTRATAWSKAVLFAARPTFISDELIKSLRATAAPWTEAEGGWPAIADVPRPGQTVHTGSPVVTVFAAGIGYRQARHRLEERAAILDRLLAATDRETGQPAILRGSGCAIDSAATR